MKKTFQSLAKDYNLFAKQKYHRIKWKNLSSQDITRHLPLREAMLNWAVQNKKITSEEKSLFEKKFNQKYQNVPKNKISLLDKKDMDTVCNLLLAGKLVVIPNGKIYVIFGADDNSNKYQITKKINSAKIRHKNLPIVRLASINDIPYAGVKNETVRKFLDKLVTTFQPVGLLLPDNHKPGRLMYVFYGGEYFEKLIKRLKELAPKPINIYVSSANITTTGANTTSLGVINDFSLDGFIYAVIEDGDLKEKSKDNNSTTIISCSETGELTYFRLGFPLKADLDQFAQKNNMEIIADITTRETFTR